MILKAKAWRCSSVVVTQPITYKALGFILSATKRKKRQDTKILQLQISANELRVVQNHSKALW